MLPLDYDIISYIYASAQNENNTTTVVSKHHYFIIHDDRLLDSTYNSYLYSIIFMLALLFSCNVVIA